MKRIYAEYIIALWVTSSKICKTIWPF